MLREGTLTGSVKIVGLRFPDVVNHVNITLFYEKITTCTHILHAKTKGYSNFLTTNCSLLSDREASSYYLGMMDLDRYNWHVILACVTMKSPPKIRGIKLWLHKTPAAKS